MFIWLLLIWLLQPLGAGFGYLLVGGIDSTEKWFAMLFAWLLFFVVSELIGFGILLARTIVLLEKPERGKSKT